VESKLPAGVSIARTAGEIRLELKLPVPGVSKYVGGARRLAVARNQALYSRDGPPTLLRLLSAETLARMAVVNRFWRDASNRKFSMRYNKQRKELEQLRNRARSWRPAAMPTRAGRQRQEPRLPGPRAEEHCTLRIRQPGRHP